ncbi:MAG: DNA polymerase/3'-5' exonuclease PolX [Acidobacteriota bacterium]
MTNSQIAKIFNEIADLLEIKGENPFKIRAYRKAALNIESLAEDMKTLLEKKQLEDLPGIGKELAKKIEEIFSTGTLRKLEELRKEVPSSLVELLSIPGLGPRTAKILYENLNIQSIDELERMAKEHKLRNLPGIREKTEENILKGIEILKKGRERLPLYQALSITTNILNALQSLPEIEKISPAGSVRRKKDTIKDIDILITSANSGKVMDKFTSLPEAKEIIAKGVTKSSIRTEEGIQVDLRVVEPDSFGSALQYFTGSKEHNIRLREMARERNLKINEYGIFNEKTGKKIGGREEIEIYKTLGLSFIEPELREDRGEIEAALERELPVLIELSDIKGDLHVHSKWSDGHHAIEEIAETAIGRGYEYIAITDHSKSLGVAGGLSEKELFKQIDEIDRLNEKLRKKNFYVFKGIEVDIDKDGNLDFSDDVLSKLDVVIAAIHTGFKQDIKTQTRRIVRAMKNKYVNLIAHPSGRLLGEREAYELDMDEILKVAKDTRTNIEINAYHLRLDLRDIFCKKAKELEVKMAIGTDAHILDQLDYIKLGVYVARRGWLEKKDVLNTYPLIEIGKYLNKRI